VPAAWRTARAFHLAPMPIETQAALVRAIRGWESPERPAFISLDPHLLVTPDSLARHRAVLAEVDAFFPSDDELLLPDAARDPAATLASLCSGRLRFVVWKRGAQGGTLYDANAKRLHTWTPRAERVEDPTGAGDAFMAGFVSALLEPREVQGEVVERALRRGVVTASFAIEGWGADGLLAATPGAVRARLAAWEHEKVGS
jgi:sugar/nucleoside kinase (ribokinase family)